MPRKISIQLNVDSISDAIRQLDDYKSSLEEKAKLVCKRLAQIGMSAADYTLSWASVHYVGEIDCEISIEEIQNGYRILADGETALTLEFGAGVTYGYGHPDAGRHGMGPGTYPDGKGHWNDPHGWYLPGGHGQHTYGNAPNMMMYNAAKTVRSQVEEIVREVFKS